MPADPLAGTEYVQSINVKLADPGDAAAFARDVAARMPGVTARATTARPDDSAGPFVVLERFHLAIAIVTDRRQRPSSCSR